jgi:hypothetical protein
MVQTAFQGTAFVRDRWSRAVKQKAHRIVLTIHTNLHIGCKQAGHSHSCRQCVTMLCRKSHLQEHFWPLCSCKLEVLAWSKDWSWSHSPSQAYSCLLNPAEIQVLALSWRQLMWSFALGMGTGNRKEGVATCLNLLPAQRLGFRDQTSTVTQLIWHLARASPPVSLFRGMPWPASIARATK